MCHEFGVKELNLRELCWYFFYWDTLLWVFSSFPENFQTLEHSIVTRDGFFPEENKAVSLKSQILGRQEAACPQWVNQNVTSVTEPLFCHRKLGRTMCVMFLLVTRCHLGLELLSTFLMEYRKAALQNEAIVVCREVWIARLELFDKSRWTFPRKYTVICQLKNSWSRPVHIVFCLCLFKYYYWKCCQFLTEPLFVFKSVSLHLELCSSFSWVGFYMIFQVCLIRAHLLLEESSSRNPAQIYCVPIAPEQSLIYAQKIPRNI